jgi:hypothetical protein
LLSLTASFGTLYYFAFFNIPSFVSLAISIFWLDITEFKFGRKLKLREFGGKVLSCDNLSFLILDRRAYD